MSNIKAQFKLTRSSFVLDVDLEIPATGVTAIFGQSGSGKTSLLRCIAGLEKNSAGFLSIQGKVWQDQQQFIPTHKRPIGYVFQDAALFPHLTAKGNLKYAMKRAVSPVEYAQYEHIVDLLGIRTILNRYPQKLSGGEKQRVAIARALLINPTILLLDEPLASLDMERKQEILPYLERLKTELKIPILYVSHSTNEIARLADTLVALNNGQVVASGPLLECLSRLDFPIKLGEDTGVVINAKVVEINKKWSLARVSFAGGELWVRDSGYPVGNNVRVRILARDISLALNHHTDSSIVNILSGMVEEIADDLHPAMALIRIKVADEFFIARITRRSVNNLNLTLGQPVWMQIKSAALVR